MEPTIQPIITEKVSTNPKKSKMIYTLIIIVMIAVIAMILIKSKVAAPTIDTPVVLSEENQQLNNEITDAITFDNEDDLQQIDKEFQP